MALYRICVANLALLGLAACQVIIEQHGQVDNITRPYEIEEKLWDDAMAHHNASFSGWGVGPGFAAPYSETWRMTIKVAADIPLDSSQRNDVNKSLVVTGTQVDWEFNSLKESNNSWPFNANVSWDGCIRLGVPTFTKHAVDNSPFPDTRQASDCRFLPTECSRVLDRWVYNHWADRKIKDQCVSGARIPMDGDMSSCAEWISTVELIAIPVNKTQAMSPGTLFMAASEPYQKGNMTAYDAAAREVWGFYAVWNGTETSKNKTGGDDIQSGGVRYAMSCMKVNHFEQNSRVPGAASSVQASVVSVLTWVVGSAVVLTMF